MAGRSSRHPTELELEILKILWRQGPCTVRQVREELAGFRDLAHTSVMTVMTIMVRKGYLKRRKQGRHYVYETLVTEDMTRKGMLEDLIDRVFAGSTQAALVHLLELTGVDESELSELQEHIRNRRKETT